MKKNLENAIKWLIYLTFFVPLLVMPTSFIFPFIVPKILLFRSLTEVMIGLYVLLLAINWQEYRPRFSLLTWAVLAFLFSFTISTFFGTDSYHSFWDNHERMLGLFTVFHYVVYFVICAQIYKSWSDWMTALRIFLFAGSLVMLIGIVQVLRPNFLLNNGSFRIIATLGNAIYVGGYGLFLFFAALLLFLKETGLGWKIAYGVSGLLGLLGMFFSSTRGSMIGLIVSLGLVLVGYAVVLKGHKRARQYLLGVIIIVPLLLVVAYFNRHSSTVQRMPALAHILDISSADLSSARFFAWGVAVEAWKDHPIIGWGPNNFFYAFNANYNPRSLEYGYGETWFDNAHNIILNTMAVQGLIGVLTYLAIFVLAIYVLLKAYRQGTIDKHILIIGGAFLVAHLVQNVTVFENPTSYLYFMFWLAMVDRLTRKTAVLEKIKLQILPNRNLGMGMFLSVMLMTAMFIFIFNIQPARANMKALETLQYINGDPIGALPLVEEALSFSSPHVDDIRSDISRALADAIIGDKKLIEDQMVKLFGIAEKALLEDIELHPFDIRLHLSLAQLYQSRAINNNDANSMVLAEKYMKRSLELSPRRQQVMFNLAIVEFQLGKSAEAEKLLMQAINDDPKISESYVRLAYAYSVLGRPKDAKAIIDLAAKNNVVFPADQQNTVDQIKAGYATSSKSRK